MSSVSVPRGWEDLDFLFTTTQESGCGGSCTLKFDGTGAPVLTDNCTGESCHCMPVFGSVAAFASARGAQEYAIPWPCVGPTIPTALVDAAVGRYLAALARARLMARLAALFGLTTLLFGGGLVALWLTR